MFNTVPSADTPWFFILEELKISGRAKNIKTRPTQTTIKETALFIVFNIIVSQ